MSPKWKRMSVISFYTLSSSFANSEAAKVWPIPLSVPNRCNFATLRATHTV